MAHSYVGPIHKFQEETQDGQQPGKLSHRGDCLGAAHRLGGTVRYNGAELGALAFISALPRTAGRGLGFASMSFGMGSPPFSQTTSIRIKPLSFRISTHPPHKFCFWGGGQTNSVFCSVALWENKHTNKNSGITNKTYKNVKTVSGLKKGGLFTVGKLTQERTLPCLTSASSYPDVLTLYTCK